MNRMLLRFAAAATALFALGHSMGYTHPRLDGEPGTVAAVMKAVHFDVFGAQRSYWEMYDGYGFLIILVAGYLAVVLWLLSSEALAAARPLLWATAALQLGFAVVGFRSFFWAPGALNAVSAVCAAVAASRRR